MGRKIHACWIELEGVGFKEPTKKTLTVHKRSMYVTVEIFSYTFEIHFLRTETNIMEKNCPILF